MLGDAMAELTQPAEVKRARRRTDPRGGSAWTTHGGSMGSTPSSPSQATALVEAVHIIRGGEAVWKTFLAAVDPLSTEERTMAKEPATQSTDDGSRDGLVSELGCAQAGTLGDISPARVG